MQLSFGKMKGVCKLCLEIHWGNERASCLVSVFCIVLFCFICVCVFDF